MALCVLGLNHIAWGQVEFLPIFVFVSGLLAFFFSNSVNDLVLNSKFSHFSAVFLNFGWLATAL
jgi:hypothetical protein